MLRRTLCAWRPMVIKMPALSPTMEKGTLTSWEKKVGDLVKSDDILARVQTDKAVVDFNHVGDDFYLARLVSEAGSRVEVGEPVALGVEEKAEVDGDEVKNWKAPVKKAAAAPVAAPVKKAEPKSAEKKAPAPAAAPVAAKKQQQQQQQPAAATSGKPQQKLSHELEQTIERSGPAVMRLAASLSAKQLESFFGDKGKKRSGLSGRFTKSDVMAAFPKVNFDEPSKESPFYLDPAAVNTAVTGGGGGGGGASSAAAPAKPAAKPYVITQEIQPGAVFNFKTSDEKVLEFLFQH